MSSYDLNDLLTLVVTDRADGLSLHSGKVPMVHLAGEPHPVEGSTISVEMGESFLRGLASTRQIRELRQHGPFEFIYTSREGARFKVQARMQHEQVELDLQRVGA